MSKEANEQLGESRERVEQFGHRRGCPPVSPPNELNAHWGCGWGWGGGGVMLRTCTSGETAEETRYIDTVMAASPAL